MEFKDKSGNGSRGEASILSPDSYLLTPKKMLLREAVEKYLNHLKLKNYSDRTRETYSDRLRVLIGFLYREGVKDTCQITTDQVKAYQSERYYHINWNGKQNHPRTRSYERHTIKRFLLYLWEQKLIEENISEVIEYIQVPRVTIPNDILTRKELMALFALPDTGTYQGYRDRVIMEVLYGTGIRHKEISSIKVENINFRSKTLLIENGKGGKDRMLPLSEICLKFLKHYIHYIRPYLVSKYTKGNTLFLSATGKPFKDRHLGGDVLMRYLTKIRKKKKITLYSFRRTYATHLIQAGAPLRHVQELLGHNDLNTTVKYLQLNIKDLQKEYRKTHPIEKLYKDTS